MKDPNLSQLVAAAQALRPLLAELVFVGGCVTGLLITDEGAADPRATLDVDAIAEITSYSQYLAFSQRLRNLDFVEDSSEGTPLCRLVRGPIIIDVMPSDQRALGFSNRWYKAALEFSSSREVSEDLQIRYVTAPYFVATKFEAYKGRGKGHFLGSHDLEDVLAVIDGRPILAAEVRSESQELRRYIQEQVSSRLS